MKNFIKTIIMLTLFMFAGHTYGQLNVQVTSSFNPFFISEGGSTQLTLNLSNISLQAPFNVPVGKLSVQVQVPEIYYDIAAAPTGVGADLFNWFDLGNGIWYGISNAEIPLAGGGPIVFEVDGILDTPNGDPQFTTITAQILAPYSDSDTNDNIPQSGLIVPVEFSSFIVQSTECNQIDVKWTTESEMNNDMFEVERKIGNGDFKSIGEIKGSGNSNTQSTYYYTDKFELEGKFNIYYRLKQNDKDGRFSYSEEIKAVYRCEKPLSFNVFPNPAVDNVNFEFNKAIDDEKVMIRIFDNNGRVVLSVPNVELDAQHNKTINLSHLAGGIYQAKVSTNSEVLIKNIIKID